MAALVCPGEELWSYYAAHEIFSVNCNADLTGDGVNDCIGGGRAGVSPGMGAGQNSSMEPVLNLQGSQSGLETRISTANRAQYMCGIPEDPICADLGKCFFVDLHWLHTHLEPPRTHRHTHT